MKYTKVKAYRNATMKRLDALKPFLLKEKLKNPTKKAKRAAQVKAEGDSK